MEELKAIPVDMADYEYAGEGANAMSYNHRRNPDLMLKLYGPGKARQSVDELILARRVFAAGISPPEPGDFVTDGERFGIRFQRIPGKVSIARAISLHPENLPRYAEEMARMCHTLHRTHVDTTEFESVKTRYQNLLAESPLFTSREKDRLSRFIEDSPDSDTALHGDLQVGNLIFDEEGRYYFIDLGDFGYGYPLFDVGMVYVTAYLSDPDFVREAFHMEPATAVRFWEAFASAYFGTDRPLSDIEEEVRPYAGLKTLLVERDLGQKMPRFREALKTVLQT